MNNSWLNTRGRVAVTSVAAFALLAGSSQAMHWGAQGGDQGHSGYQAADPAQLPLPFRYQQGDSVKGSPLISAGLTLADQRIVYSHLPGDNIGLDPNSRVRIRRFSDGASIANADLDDESQIDEDNPNYPDTSDTDGWGTDGTIAPAIASDHGAPGQVYAVYNDDNAVWEADPNPGMNDISIAQIDASAGTVVNDLAIGGPVPQNILGGTDGYTIESSPVISADQGGGTQLIVFTMRSASGTDKRLVKVVMPNAASGTDNIASASFDWAMSDNIADIDVKQSPTLVRMRTKGGSRVLMAALATSDGVRTIRLSDPNLADAGPSIEGIGPARTISTPSRTDGNPPSKTDFIYVATQTEGEGTIVHKLEQDESDLTDAEKLATLVPVDDRSTSPELSGKPGPALAVEQGIPTSGPALGVPQPGHVIVGTSTNVYSLDTEDLAAADPPRVFANDVEVGFDKTIPATSGGFGFISDRKGQQYVFHTSAPAPGEPLRVLPSDDGGFTPAEQSLNSLSSIGGPAISRGRVVFPANNGVFLYGPTVSITRPATGGSVTGSAVTLESYVFEPDLTKVRFYIDDEPVGTDTVDDDSLFAVSWDSLTLPDGPHTLAAEATDDVRTERSAPRRFIVNNFETPTALLTVSPSPANPGQPVTLDASGSKPTATEIGETITQWAFEVDGDDDYDDFVETAGGDGDGVVTTSFSAGTHLIGVRVTDSHGDVAQKTATLRVNSAPAANLTATPNPASAGQPVTLDASGSSDADGSVARFEFDLDGDGSYETDQGVNPKVTTAFAKTTMAGVQVTDDEGAKSSARLAITVAAAAANQAPTAAFTVRPGSARPGRAVTFDASASRDPDGSIARYEWDFDGNGTYEANSGASPKMTRRFRTPGVYFVKLRVVDAGGAAAVSTASVIVASCLRSSRCVPALRASTTRTSSGGAPYVFVTKGRLTVPAGVRRADGCAGRVSIQVKAGGRTISTRRVRVDRSCAFSGRVTFGDASRFGSERSLRFVVRFQGNTLLTPKAARVQTVRIA